MQITVTFSSTRRCRTSPRRIVTDRPTEEAISACSARLTLPGLFYSAKKSASLIAYACRIGGPLIAALPEN